MPAPPTILPVNREPIKEATPIRTNNLFDVRCLANMVPELVTLLARFEVEGILKKREGLLFTSFIGTVTALSL